MRFKHAKQWPRGTASPRYSVVAINEAGEASEPLVTGLTGPKADAYLRKHRDPTGPRLELRRCDDAP